MCACLRKNIARIPQFEVNVYVRKIKISPHAFQLYCIPYAEPPCCGNCMCMIMCQHVCQHIDSPECNTLEGVCACLGVLYPFHL